MTTTNEPKRKVICGWCEVVMSDGFEPATHGICDDCKRKWDESKGDYCGIRGGQGRTGEEVAKRTSAALVALAVLAGIGIILAFVQAIC